MKKYDKPDTVFLNLFDAEHLLPETDTEWVGMPTYINDDLTPHRQLIVSFESADDVKLFCDKLGVELTERTRSIYYPPQAKKEVADLFWFGDAE